MLNVLCFGDSNTWGCDPVATAKSLSPVRHPAEIRWTGVMAMDLGSGYRVIEEGQNGRTTVHEDPTAWASRNAHTYLPSCLESQKPLDLVILMLGTNDLKTMFGLSPSEIASGSCGHDERQFVYLLFYFVVHSYSFVMYVDYST
jgi:lysophospholipase L1-like esterase